MSLYDLLLAGTALVLFGGMLGGFELGFRLARRTAKPNVEPTLGGTDIMDAAVFSLLGLLLAFEFAGAASRLQTRREHAIAEVNAISTAYSRMDLLGDNEKENLQELFRNYLDARIRSREAMPDLEAARKELDQAQVISTQIWTTAIAACKRNTDTPGLTQVVIPALNDMTDRSTDSAYAGLTHSPVMLQVFTFIVALIGAMLVGVRSYARKNRPWLHLLIFTTVISFTFFMILDLEFPRAGFVGLGTVDQAFVEVRESMN